MTLVQDRSGNSFGVDPGFAFSGIRLANNTTVAANSGTNPTTAGSSSVNGFYGGTRAWDVQFTGTSIKLQALGSDGATWRDVATASTAGVSSVYIGAGTQLRLYNPNGTDDTNVSSTLS